jgi:hypothetical protein
MGLIIHGKLAEPRSHKMKTARVGAVSIALLALGAVVYFYAILPYANS